MNKTDFPILLKKPESEIKDDIISFIKKSGDKVTVEFRLEDTSKIIAEISYQNQDDLDGFTEEMMRNYSTVFYPLQSPL